MCVCVCVCVRACINLPPSVRMIYRSLLCWEQKHALTASSLFKFMDTKRNNRVTLAFALFHFALLTSHPHRHNHCIWFFVKVSQRQFALGLEHIGVYAGRASVWRREGSSTPRHVGRSNRQSKRRQREKEKRSLSWTLTLSRQHLTRLFQVPH